jgi:hypothetical protein
MIFLLAIFLILFEAIYEGLKTRGFHIASASVEFVYRAVITIGLILWVSDVTLFHSDHLLWKSIGGYILLRFAIFDLIWNISAGQNIFYLGRTKLYDKYLSKVPVGFVWFIKIIVVLPVGLTWLIR